MLSLNLQSRIRGICPLAAVPFQEDGSVDYAQFDRLIRSFLKTGVNGICCGWCLKKMVPELLVCHVAGVVGRLDGGGHILIDMQNDIF